MLAPGHERAVGFKLPMQSIRLDPAAAKVALSDRELAAIRLSRRDRLSQLVSRRMMAATGVSQSIFGDYGNTSVQIEPAAAIAALEAMSADEQELDGLCAGRPAFRIDYEELGDEQRLVELQRFLGLEPEPLRSSFEKLRTRSLPETVSNWDELQERPEQGRLRAVHGRIARADGATRPASHYSSEWRPGMGIRGMSIRIRMEL